ncbi:T9SS type A sorting domain-containing protein [Cecembia calidifontis]|uniref:Putative secreted protein (Por secretion system target) n=1 Tax=Cecembia calidifontis TaxID=1187080 RepID=A0A4Q7PD95_9BACT|nr:T9SS type A sorting domain-containing protein [Cecembia calidifontis]RZS98336.1 putative secreted protein (Por secretion system target) [Cecembia calidifontis]
MKKAFIYFIFFLISFTSVSQTDPPKPDVIFTPYGSSPFWYGEQTSFSLGYKIDADNVNSPICSTRSASVTGNGGATATINPTLDDILVTWGNQKTESQGAKVKITFGSCNNSLFNRSFESQNSYHVMSIIGETPSQINNSSSLNVPICQTNPVSFSISPMAIPNGVGRAASGYEWTIPAGWKFADGTTSNGTGRLFTSANAHTQSFIPNCSSVSGSVTVRAWTNTEGRGTPHYSLPRAIVINRTPSLTITTPNEIKCGVPFLASVQDLPCAVANGYNWNLPSGWTMTGTGRTRTITPAGSTSQTLSVNISLSSGCVVTTSKSITPQNAGTILGPPNESVCSGGSTFSLIDAPTNSSISWTVTPSNRVVTSSGNGSSAFLQPSSNPGTATLRFTVSGACNYVVTKQIKVGPIQTEDIINPAFDSSAGGYPYVCPNGVYVTHISPYNPNYQYEVQVTNGYSTQYGSNPNSFVINIANYSPSQYVDAAVSVRVNNGCGWSQWKTTNLYSDPFSCPPGSGCNPENGDICLLLYPNPSSEEVSVSLLGVEEHEKKTGKSVNEGQVLLYDKNGNLRKVETISKKKTMYIQDLPAGIYILHYRNGNYITKTQLKIEK